MRGLKLGKFSPSHQQRRRRAAHLQLWHDAARVHDEVHLLLLGLCWGGGSRCRSSSSAARPGPSVGHGRAVKPALRLASCCTNETAGGGRGGAGTGVEGLGSREGPALLLLALPHDQEISQSALRGVEGTSVSPAVPARLQLRNVQFLRTKRGSHSLGFSRHAGSLCDALLAAHGTTASEERLQGRQGDGRCSKIRCCCQRVRWSAL